MEKVTKDVLEKNNFNYNDFKSFSNDELNNLENIFKECQKDKKFINYFGNDNFIRFTKESLDKYTEGNDNKFKFANFNISLCLEVAKRKVHFAVRLSKDEEFMKCLNKWLQYIIMVSNPSEHQSSVLAGILLLYWYVIKQKHLFSNDIIESIKKCFSESVYNNNIKVAAALCLAYIIDHSDSFVTKIFDCLINYEQMKNFVNITEEDILLGLGKISLRCIPFKFEETLKKCVTKLFNFHWIPSNSFPQDIYDDLKIIYDNIGDMNDECLEVLIKSKFLDVSHKSLDMFLKLMKKSLENNLALDFIMLNLSIICDLCDQRINFAKNVCDKRSLTSMLNVVLKDLSYKSSLSSSEKQFLETILFIYWNILKHGLTLSDKISTKMKTLFDNSNINTECKIASSLCLAMTNDENIESMIKVKGYLEKLLKENNEDEIYGFPKCEIYIAFGKVNICCTTTDKQSSNNLDSDICTHVQKYKSLLEKLVLNIDTIDDKSVIDSAMELNMPKLMIEFIKKLNPALNLNENPGILNYFILENDKSYLEILLSCCKFGVKNYEVLFELLSRKDNIVELASKKIITTQLTQSDNRRLLTIAFNHVENENWNFFKIIVDKCEFPNDYLLGDNSTETFLTKMLADLPISSITEVWKHCKFNTNIYNKKHISPLMIASKSVEKLQWLVINKTGDFKEAELDKVKKASNELTSTNDRNQIMNLLNSIETNENL